MRIFSILLCFVIPSLSFASDSDRIRKLVEVARAESLSDFPGRTAARATTSAPSLATSREVAKSRAAAAGFGADHCFPFSSLGLYWKTIVCLAREGAVDSPTEGDFSWAPLTSAVAQVPRHADPTSKPVFLGSGVVRTDWSTGLSVPQDGAGGPAAPAGRLFGSTVTLREDLGPGDDCFIGSDGNKKRVPRQTTVVFECANRVAVLAVTEVATCRYEVTFGVPTLCATVEAASRPRLDDAKQHPKQTGQADHRSVAPSPATTRPAEALSILQRTFLDRLQSAKASAPLDTASFLTSLIHSETPNGCLLLRSHGAWTYEYCPAKTTLTQRQMSSGTLVSLGQHVVPGSAVLDKRGFSLRLDEGTPCSAKDGQARSAEIRFSCRYTGPGAASAIAAVDEVSPCEYLVRVQSPWLCAHPDFRYMLPPAKQALRDDLLLEALAPSGAKQLFEPTGDSPDERHQRLAQEFADKPATPAHAVGRLERVLAPTTSNAHGRDSSSTTGGGGSATTRAPWRRTIDGRLVAHTWTGVAAHAPTPVAPWRRAAAAVAAGFAPTDPEVDTLHFMTMRLPWVSSRWAAELFPTDSEEWDHTAGWTSWLGHQVSVALSTVGDFLFA